MHMHATLFGLCTYHVFFALMLAREDGFVARHRRYADAATVLRGSRECLPR